MRPEDFKGEIERAMRRMAEDIWARAKQADEANLLAAHPVGSYYISENATSPAELFGGTWEKIEDYTIAAASSSHAAGSTEGSRTHTLSADEMPAHTHTGPSHSHTATTVSSGAHSHTATTNSAGGHSHTATTSWNGDHTHTATTSWNGDHNHSYYYAQLGIDPTNFGSMIGFHTGHGWERNSNDIRNAGGHNHTLTTNSAGGHNHTLTTNSAGGHTHTLTTASSGAHTHTLTTANSGTGNTGSAGGGQAFPIMQPTIYAHVWKRTA